MYIVKGQIQTRPLTFLSNLIKFVTQLKATDEMMALIDAFVPSLKEKVKKINQANISKLIKCTEYHFIIEQFKLSE